MKLSLTLTASLATVAGAAAAFDPPSTYFTPQRPAGVALGDFDGDGDMDMAVATDNLDKISIFTNDGSGTYTGPVTVLTGANTGPDDMIAADLDGDGDEDLAVVLKNTNSVAFMRNDGGFFTMAGTTGVGSRPVDLEAGDFDGDGDVDLATANRDSNTTSILTNSGAGTFFSISVGVGNEPRGVAAGDWDGDSDMDLAVTNHDDRTVSILTNTGGAFTPSGTLSVGGAFRPEGIDAADLDGDGDMDLAVATDFSATIFTNFGGAWTGPVHFGVGTAPDQIMIAELTGDAFPEIVTVNQDANSISILDNLGGTYGAPLVLSSGGVSAERVVAGPIDGNSSNDLVVTNRDSDNTAVFLNQFTGVPCDADWNGDGSADIFDVLAYLADFGGGSAGADITGDTILDIFDVLAFLGIFQAGC